MTNTIITTKKVARTKNSDGQRTTLSVQAQINKHIWGNANTSTEYDNCRYLPKVILKLIMKTLKKEVQLYTHRKKQSPVKIATTK